MNFLKGSVQIGVFRGVLMSGLAENGAEGKEQKKTFHQPKILLTTHLKEVGHKESYEELFIQHLPMANPSPCTIPSTWIPILIPSTDPNTITSIVYL